MAVHPTAVIDSAAVIDPAASIGAYCVIEGPVRIGAGTVVSPFVHILGDTHIGAECRIHTGTVVGDLPQDKAFQGTTPRSGSATRRRCGRTSPSTAGRSRIRSRASVTAAS